MRWLFDTDDTTHRREPVLIDRTEAPTPAAVPEEPLVLDKDQRALVDAQWALVERAFRRDLVRSEDRKVPQAAAPEPSRPAQALVQPAVIAPANGLVETPRTQAPIDRSVDGPATRSDAQPKVRSRWFGRPSVAEQKRIVKPKWFAASAVGGAPRQRTMLMSLVAIACASAALVFWRLDPQVDRPVTAERPASASAASGAPAQVPAKPLAAIKPSARPAPSPRPASTVPPAAAGEADAGAARTASQTPVVERRQERPDSQPPALAPTRTPSPQRADVAPARSARTPWQRDQRMRDDEVRARTAPSWVAPSPEPEPSASGPLPAPLPYHPATWPSRRSAGAGAEMPRESAAPLPYGGPEVGNGPGGR